MAKHSCLLDATVLIIANGAPSKSGWATERARLLLMKESESRKISLETIRTRAHMEGQSSWRGAGKLLVGWAEDHCPLGRLSPSPSYNLYFSSSTGCKSRFGRCKGDETEMIFIFFPTCFDKILFCLCLEGVLCTATGAHSNEGDT